MKFSMIFEAQMVDTSRANEAQVMHDCVEQAVACEQYGFDKVWAVEHHCLKWYAHMSAPETFLAFVAGKTERIRIGHGVVCLPHGWGHDEPGTQLSVAAGLEVGCVHGGFGMEGLTAVIAMRRTRRFPGPRPARTG